MSKHGYIAFEGPIAAGKTTHAELLAKKLDAELLLENFPSNEFLADFYGDKTRWSLPMQLSFLMMRHAQLAAVQGLLGRTVVVDYSCFKNDIFAQTLLCDRELRLYELISGTLGATAFQHDLIVYLDADNEVLLDRIRQRGRPYESSIDSEYLDRLREGYERSFRAVPGLQVLRYSTSDLDLDSNAEVGNLHTAILYALQKP
jgi:deoxyguanosine kinase